MTQASLSSGDGSTLPLYEFNRYHGSKLTHRLSHHDPAETLFVKTAHGSWRVDRTSVGALMDNPPGGERMKFVFTLLEGAEFDASVGVSFPLAGWSEDVHAFMPGGLYQGNRFRSYPCGWYGCYAPEDVQPDADQIISDIPRLQWRKGTPSKVQLLTRDLASPMVGFWDRGNKQALVYLTNQGDVRGDTLLEIEENEAHDAARVRFTSPGVRDHHHTLEGMVASPDRGTNFAAGDSVSLELVIWRFSCDSLRAFHRFFFGIRKLGMPDRAETPEVSFSRVMEFQAQVVSTDRWSETHRLFRDEEESPWYFQTGWTGGMMKDYAVCASGTSIDRAHVREALRTYGEGWSPSGLMYGRFDPERGWMSDNDVPQFAPLASRPDMKHWTLARRHGDVLHYLLKTAALMRVLEPGYEPPADWLHHLQRSADVLCRTFAKFGQLGQYLDQQTGDVLLGGSTAAASVPTGLLWTWRMFNEAMYLETAKAIASQLYVSYTAFGNMNGTPADILQSPDCEGPTLLLEGLCDLHAATGDKEWLDMAEHCAWLLSSWVMGYDYDFSRHFPGCEFHRLHLKTTGAIIASVQNRIGTPGLCVGSGLPLLRLYRATGETHYLELLRDIVSCQLRSMARPEKRSYGEDGSPIPAGWIAERFSTTDVHMPGAFWKASTPWCQTSLMLACIEIPSVYVVLDSMFAYAFDALRVDCLTPQGESLELTLTNPTAYPARYTLMIENAADQARPLPEFHFLKFHSIDFRPGETRTVTIPSRTRSPVVEAPWENLIHPSPERQE